MFSLLLMTALAVQTPAASKPATDTTANRTTRQPATAAVSRAAFHDAMRMLWEDHVVYTRNYIISASAGLADTTQVAERLMRNQGDIGNAIKPYYGEAAAAQLTALLSSHIIHAAKIIGIAKGSSPAMNVGVAPDASVKMSSDTLQIKANAQYPTATGRGTDTTKQQVPASPQPTQVGVTASAQTTDPNALNAAIAAWRANGDSIATFLSGANPRNWSRSTLQSAFNMHLDMTLKEATAYLQRDWAGSIAAYDEIHQQILQMADVLSEGIMKQFPTRFNNRATTMSSLQ